MRFVNIKKYTLCEQKYTNKIVFLLLKLRHFKYLVYYKVLYCIIFIYEII